MSRRAYPRHRIEAALLQAELPPSYRILPRRYLAAPLGAAPADSRFCRRAAGYTVLYASPDFATAFLETVVRDRFMRRPRREIGFVEVTERAWALIATKPGAKLTLLDLRRDGCTLIGAPTDTVNARNHAAGRAFGKAVHTEHADVDGLLYAFRLTGADVYATFDRGVGELEARETGILPEHPELSDVLARHGIHLVLEH